MKLLQSLFTYLSASDLLGSERDGRIWQSSSIQTFDSPLPLFALGDAVIFPSDVLDDILHRTAPENHFSRSHQNGSTFVYDGDWLASYFDNSTGQTSLFPRLESLRPAASINPRPPWYARFLSDPRIFPMDDTWIAAVRDATLFGSKNKSGFVTPSRPYMTDVRIERNISYSSGDYSVCGPGSNARFSFTANGRVAALIHRWRPAKFHSNLEPASAENVRRAILAQIASANLQNATVTAIDFCYYDSGEKYIQPVYRYMAKIQSPSGLPNISFTGYVHAGIGTRERLPTLTQPPGKDPSQASTAPHNSSSTHPARTRLSVREKPFSIDIGRFVMSDTDLTTPAFLPDAVNFLKSLQANAANGPKRGLVPFVDLRYFWDAPQIYTSDKEVYINAVELAFSVGYGDALTLFMDGKTWKPVRISDIPPSGYGNGAGYLAQWIVHAGAFLPSGSEYAPADVHKVFDPWWSVFNGLHSVMGYRTDAQAYDGVPPVAAKNIALGTSVVWSWLSAVINAPAYNPDHFYGFNPITGEKIWWGRPAAISQCEYTDENAYALNFLGRPDCLYAWWYDY
jgi:hypothetical protein